jgi:hypothetical protein
VWTCPVPNNRVERHLNNNREKQDRRKEHGKKKSFAAV